MRDNKYHIADGQLIKTSNGQPVPDEEPVFILRARDALAITTLEVYKQLAEEDGTVPEEHINGVQEKIDAFRQFRVQYYDRIKAPGITRGA